MRHALCFCFKFLHTASLPFAYVFAHCKPCFYVCFCTLRAFLLRMSLHTASLVFVYVFAHCELCFCVCFCTCELCFCVCFCILQVIKNRRWERPARKYRNKASMQSLVPQYVCSILYIYIYFVYLSIYVVAVLPAPPTLSSCHF